MKKRSNKQLKMIRNILCFLGIAVGFLLWILLPETFPNTGLFHVGNGETGSKYGALILLLIPFFALIPDFEKEEIHTEDAEERAAMKEAREKKELTRQILTAAGLALTIWVVFIVAGFLLR